MKVYEKNASFVIDYEDGSAPIPIATGHGRFHFNGTNTIIRDELLDKTYEAPTAELKNETVVIGDQTAVLDYLSVFVGK